MIKTSIYTLSDPRTNEVRYVGSSFTPRLRYKAHKREVDKSKRRWRVNKMTAKERWFRELWELGLYPIMEVVDSCDDDDRGEVENSWIAKYEARGVSLTNSRKASAKGL